MDGHDTPWLSDTEQTAWRSLLSIVSTALPEIERQLRANGLLAVQYHILAALSEAPGHTLRLSQLAQGANVSQSRLSHRMRDLIACGDVIIEGDAADRRAKNATLTRAGMDRLERVAPGHAELVRRLLFEPLSTRQTTALADALSTVSDHVATRPCD